nr:MAG TPA: putative tail fiber protein [Caudoviricetes sp.]
MIQKKSLKDAIQNPEIISVVGELLNINESWLRYRGFSSDLNSASLNGVYMISSGAQNSPFGGSGKCLVFGNDSGDVAQLALSWDTKSIYIRGKNDVEWKKITI